MTTSTCSRLVAAVAGLVAVTACGRGGQPASADARPGQAGTSYDVTVSRQPGGTVTSADGRIDCGTAAAATRCGPVTYAWSEAAVLTATADAGFMFGTWAGDCLGRQKVADRYVCILDTSRSGADKYVVASFGEQGRTLHPNFSEPAVHGPAFLDWIARKPDTFECTHCHGATYAGIGIALSCNDCHARAGFPGWLTRCDFCHEAPPPPPPAGKHPRASTDVRFCWGCHQETVDANGALVAGGKHMNGDIDATGGHVDGYVSPSVHGRDFFDFVSGNAELACASCHGAAYDVRIARGRSCNTCHASSGWASWQTNCSFCHGVKDATTQAAAYDVAEHPTWSAPPHAVSERLSGAPAPERTGAHVAHLTEGEFAAGFRCDACHEVPATLTHVSGREARAAVVLMAPGQAAPDPDGYDPGTGTCATRCHGATGSPAWSSTGLACGDCHPVPAASAVHAGLSSADLGACAGCHPDTITPAGALDVAGGKHLNGTVDRVGGHAAGFAVPSAHGPQFLDSVAGVAAAGDCKSCHGETLGYCSSCHSQPASGGWASWQTNCTFCHGTRTPVYAPASLTLASPPDAVAQRLTGSATGTATRTGKHRTHLNGKSGYNGQRCDACHAVPATVAHVAPDRRATVAFSAAAAFPGLTPAQLAALPVPFGSYDSSNRCTGYCHGSTMQGGLRPTVTWSTAGGSADCSWCHGSPPDSGKTLPLPEDDLYCPGGCSIHSWHVQALPDLGYDGCDNCHEGSATSNARGLHVNGIADIEWRTTGLPYTGTWDPVARTCAMSCHSTPEPRSWR